MNKDKIKIGISIGDINGIGLEIIIKTLMDNRMMNHFTPIVYGSPRIASYHRKVLGINDFSFNRIRDVKEASQKRPNMQVCWNEEVIIELGKSSNVAGEYALKSLQYALDDLKTGKIQALVTAPVNKNNMQSDAFKFPGHTEYLQHEFGASNSLMFLISDNLRVGVVTGHIPLKEVASQITKENILKKLKLMNNSLKTDFGISKPRIAVLGLNPHAGDNGTLGMEEQEIIAPAIQHAKENNNILAFGPYPADGFFGSGKFSSFDAVLAMYHDQGLIPFKALEFGSGVNFTAGLPIIRTSPDHGTGYDIAGKNQADIDSFRSAIFAAIDIYKTRNENLELMAGAIK